MGGWFLDVWVGYLVSLFRMVARKRRARRCSGWRETTATIVGVSWQASSYLPRPVAEIVYTYRIDGGFYGGVDEKPFCLKSSAKNYANKIARGDNLIIRVKPGEPEVSIVRDEDQVKQNQSTSGLDISN